MLTMLLGGLWHGASWNFMIWGGYHGALLSIERVLRGDRKPDEKWGWTYPLRALLTFVLVMVSWVFFRAADLRQSAQVLGAMFGFTRGGRLLETWHIELAVLALVVALVEEKLEWFERMMRAPAFAYAATLAAMFLCLEVFGVVDEAIPFIYFQF
jgi:D-alanyl-lipoteichoic acid acyltransferase DltB (MBOAT superfamily)